MVDQALMTVWRVQWQRLLRGSLRAPTNGDVPFPVVAYFLADSSPQGSVNWMNHELIFIKGIDVLLVAKALRNLVHLCRPLDDNTDVEMDREAYEALERGYMKTICEKVVHHYGVPAGLGSARCDLLHELHAFYHSHFMETGATDILQALVKSFISGTTDKGTESHFAGSHPVRFGDFYPYFTNTSIEEEDDLLQEERRNVTDDKVIEQLDEVYCQPCDPDAMLSLENCLGISGGLHFINKIAQGCLFAMPNYKSSFG